MIDLNQRYSSETLTKEIREIARTHPRTAACRTIGYSRDGRPVSMLCVGRGDRVLFCTAGIHGRESVNPAVLVKMAGEYARGFEDCALYAGKYDLRRMLTDHAVCFVPLVNPDGYEIALGGLSAVRDARLRDTLLCRGTVGADWKKNAGGVDINRNFPARSYAGGGTGDHPASEPETRALIRLFGQFDSVGYLDFHSRGRVLYYHREAMSEEYNRESRLIAMRLRGECGYTLGEPEEEFSDPFGGGNSVQYYSETYALPAITVETVEEDAGFPLQSSLQREVWREVRALPLAFLELVPE